MEPDEILCKFCKKVFGSQANVVIMSPCSHPVHQECYRDNCLSAANLSCSFDCTESRVPRGAINIDGSQFMLTATAGSFKIDENQRAIALVQRDTCTICTMPVYEKSHYIQFFCRKHTAHILCCGSNTDACTTCNTVANCIETEKRATTPNEGCLFVKKIIEGPVLARSFYDMRFVLSDKVVVVPPVPSPVTFMERSIAGFRSLLGEDDKTAENSDVQTSFAHDVKHEASSGDQLSHAGYSRLDFMGSAITWEAWMKSGRSLSDAVALNVSLDDLHAVGFFTHRPAVGWARLAAPPFSFEFVDFLYHFSAGNFIEHVADFASVFDRMGFSESVADAMCIDGNMWNTVSHLKNFEELIRTCGFLINYLRDRNIGSFDLQYNKRIAEADKFISTPGIKKKNPKPAPLPPPPPKKHSRSDKRYPETLRLVNGEDSRRRRKKPSSKRT